MSCLMLLVLIVIAVVFFVISAVVYRLLRYLFGAGEGMPGD